jgi:hypothetical protein
VTEYSANFLFFFPKSFWFLVFVVVVVVVVGF